jgi:hypothetical protein
MNTILVGRHFLYFLGLYFIIYEGTLGIFINKNFRKNISNGESNSISDWQVKLNVF